MLIRPATVADRPALAAIILPTIRAGATYALDPDMAEDAALAYWLGPDRQTFVAEADGQVLGTYYLRANQAGGGGHVANCGYMTRADATGRGVARAMCADFARPGAGARLPGDAVQLRGQRQYPRGPPVAGDGLCGGWHAARGLPPS